MNVGSLIFIEDEKGKCRPHVCVLKFTNDAGIAYDWLVLPITSNKTVGSKNLVKVEHPKLKEDSYAKLNNVRTINVNDDIEVHSEKFSKACMNEIVERLKNVLNV